MSFLFWQPYFYLGLLVFGLLGCKQETEPQAIIPDVPVREQVYLNTIEASALRNQGGFLLIEGGYKGIVVAYTFEDEFVAYERACPHDPESSCPGVLPDETGLKLVDSCCGSAFSLNYNYVLSGPARNPLKEYEVSKDGSTLRIRNQ